MAYDLELRNVGKVYPNGTPAVIEFDLAVTKGEFIAFLGPSGCGKTTTLRMIAGFESISSGDLLIRGKRINDVPPERRPTAMIFQNYALFPHMTVRDNVAFGLSVKGMPKPERDSKVDRILAALDLEDIGNQRTERLSGGQRQRIALARGLVIEPDILLLDEPLGALDANLRKAIQHELRLLQKNLGITFVFVTHAQSEALSLSDRIVVMNQGRVEQIAAPYEVYTRPGSEFVAQFIGRNTVFAGSLKEARGGMALVETAHGIMTGRSNATLSPGQSAKIVIPAEAIDVYAEGEGRSDGGCVAARVLRSDVIGHINHLALELPEGRTLAIEAHVDKYPPDAVRPGVDVRLSWLASEATVISSAF